MSRKFPINLSNKLEQRKQDNSLRTLPEPGNGIDFSSNDYLGFAQSKLLFEQTRQLLHDRDIHVNGATGSRLISGNHKLYEETEKFIAKFHEAQSALIFNSGYDANLGFFQSVPQRGDLIVFDELCHASIRDGISLSHAKSYKFAHNDYEALEELLQKQHSHFEEIYVATESVFSMDGDSPSLQKIAEIAEKYNCRLVVDEAHALGVFGKNGEGLLQELKLHDQVFARIMTFGKGLGCHGAAILGSSDLRDYLVNFARSFIYTTGLPPHSVAAILTAYNHLQNENQVIETLRDRILHFSQMKNQLGLKPLFVYSKSAIQSAIIPGNEQAKHVAVRLQNQGFNIKAILSPTVPQGQERLRICLHNYNSAQEISQLLENLQASL